MADIKRKYTKREFARRGIALHKEILPTLTESNRRKFIAIDIETGEYELSRSEMAAADRLYKRIPDAQVWLVNAGTGYLDHFAGCRPRPLRP